MAGSMFEKFYMEYKLFKQDRTNQVLKLSQTRSSWFDTLPDIPMIKIMGKLDKVSLIKFIRAYWWYWGFSINFLCDIKYNISNLSVSDNTLDSLLRLFSGYIKSINFNTYGYLTDTLNLFFSQLNSITSLYISCELGQTEMICNKFKFLKELAIDCHNITNDDFILIANELNHLKSFQVSLLFTDNDVNDGMQFLIRKAKNLSCFGLYFGNSLSEE